MGTGVSRRQFMKGSAGVAATTMAARFATLTRDALGAPTEIPPGARTIEAGLASFVAKWQIAGPVIVLTRFGRFLSNRVFNCRVGGDPRSYVLTLGAAGATLTPGIDPAANANIVYEEADWLGILYGDFSGLAPVLGGRSWPTRDEANKAMLLGIVLYVFAHIPAGAAPDPDLLQRIILGAIDRRGVPSCAGQPSVFQGLDEINADPPHAATDMVLAPTRTVPVTKLLADFVADLSYDDIPAGCITSAKEQLTSILGALYAGSVMTPGRRTAATVRGWGEGGTATVFGSDRYATSPRNAAMVNSYLAQILEWEDWTFVAHSGASIIPVALAAAEHAHASGKELLTAIVAANEILARAGDVLTDVVNTGNALAVHQLETTLVAGKLLGLSSEQLQDALGIACTQPQMTSIISWTADAKGMLTAWPATTGMTAALFAQAGMSGQRTIIENGMGYAARISDVGSPRALEKMVEKLGTLWRFDAKRDELFTKRYPTDGFQLTSVDACIALRSGPLAAIPRAELADRIARIEMRIPLVMAASATMFSSGPGGQQALFDRVADPARPDWTYIALLFDGVWPVAASLADGELTYRQYAEEKLTDPVIRALSRKVVEIPDLTMGVFGATARVEMTDGTVHEQFKGCIEDFDVDEKLVLGARAAGVDPSPIIDAIARLQDLSDVRELTALA